MEPRLQRLTQGGVYHYTADGRRVEGPHDGLRGNVSGLSGNVSGLRGDVSGIRGDVSGISGNVDGLRGDVSGIRGDVDKCGLTAQDRAEGVDISVLVTPPAQAGKEE